MTGAQRSRVTYLRGLAAEARRGIKHTLSAVSIDAAADMIVTLAEEVERQAIQPNELAKEIIAALSVMHYAGPVEFESAAAERLVQALRNTGMSDFEINMAARNHMESQR